MGEGVTCVSRPGGSRARGGDSMGTWGGPAPQLRIRFPSSPGGGPEVPPVAPCDFLMKWAH